MGAARATVILEGLIASGIAFAPHTMSTGTRGVEGSGRLTTAALLRRCRSVPTPVRLGDPGGVAYRQLTVSASISSSETGKRSVEQFSW